jgi:hypothetical protein|nr:MAG TPA: hypothetical protein [Caudoviricetes sp.]
MIDKENGYDIVIPYDGLGNSLKNVLRTIDKHVPVKNIFLVTDKVPDWIHNVEVVTASDVHKSNKDANLIDKVLAAIKTEMIEGDFIFWSDDQAILSKYVPGVITNARDPHTFESDNKWEKRLKRTVEFVEEKAGTFLNFNYDSHCPQMMNRLQFLQLEDIDYQSDLGYCICTLFFGLYPPVWPVFAQDNVKHTVEKSGVLNEEDLRWKRFLGFNETGYTSGGVRAYLEKNFPDKSVYEK